MQSYLAHGTVCAKLPQDYLFAPFNAFKSIDSVLLGLEAVNAMCRVNIFRNDVPKRVH